MGSGVGSERRREQAPERFAQRWRLAVALGTLLGATLLASFYYGTRREVVLWVNGRDFCLRTHQRSAARILTELGIVLHSEDTAALPDDEELDRGTPIRLTLARAVVVLHDGSATHRRSQARKILDAVDDAGIVSLEHDSYIVEGRSVQGDAPLPALSASQNGTVRDWVQAVRRPVSIVVRRAVPITVRDGNVSTDLHTTAKTIGQALYEHGFSVYAGDQIHPALSAQVSAGLIVYLRRAKPVTLTVGGQARMLRTRQTSVEGLLDAQSIDLGPLDYVQPDLSAPLVAAQRVKVVRVVEERLVEEIPIPFETKWEPDPKVEIDNREIAAWGREGARRRILLVRYEDQEELLRTTEDEWIEREPLDRIIRYGTKIVLRELETLEGIVTYWRKLRVLATSYNAPTAGKPPDHRTYGITRLGLRARMGIVAVDPRVINLRQNMFVPDYGLGVAGDTGGAIKWRRIDLCYDDDNLVLWYRWVDAYLLEPIPAAEDINWIIPNYPMEKE